MQERIEKLEIDQERKKSERRKRNVVIKAIKRINSEKLKIEEEVEKFIQEKLGIETKIEKALTIREKEGRKVIVATVEKWEMKRQIMSKKRKLEKGIYIEDDLTKKEREIHHTRNAKKNSKKRKRERKGSEDRIHESKNRRKMA